jgi:hypothetical protein
MARKESFDMTADPAAFDEAVAEFASRRVVSREEADTLDAYARKRAWWISGVAQMDIANDAHESLLAAIRDGIPFDEWQKTAGPKLEAAWGKPNTWRLLVIYRNATTSAYNAGRLEQMEEPHITAVRPFKMLEVVDDGHTCEICGQFIEPKIILPWDDPWWVWHSPQFHHACRCGVRSLRRKVAEKFGITSGPPVIQVQIPDGWGLKPNLAEPPKPSERIKPPDPDLQLEAAVKAGKDLRERKPVEIPQRFIGPKQLTARDIMAQQLAGPGGSNAGGVFLGSDGVKRYVKLYDDPAQAAGEHLANQLYADLGLPAVKSFVFDHNGKLAYASEFIEGASPIGVKGLAPELASKALDGLVGDLVVANWDAVGLSLDNIVVTKAGEVVRIDNGGAFLMRAQAGRKPGAVLEQLPEWKGFFDRNINPSYSRVANAAGASSADDLWERIEKQLTALEAIEDSYGGWGPYVRKHAPQLSESDSDAIASMLTARTKLIGDKLAKAKAEAIAKLQPKPRKSRAPRKPPPKRVRLDELEAEKIPQFPAAFPGSMPNPTNATQRQEATRLIRERSNAELLALATDDERAAIRVFTGSSYGSIRAAARLTKEEYLKNPKNTMLYEVARNCADLITSAIAKHEATRKTAKRLANESVELFRGIRNVPKAKFEEILNWQSCTWAEPTSSSWKPSVAKDFYTPLLGDTGYSVMFRIKHAKATRGVSIEGISQLDNEHEILFGNDAEFRVTKVVRDADFDRGAIVYLEEIG